MNRRRLLCAVTLLLYMATNEDQAEQQGLRISCGRFRPSMDLDCYSHQLACCALPGPRIKAFIAGFDGSPVERLAAAYLQLRADWTYLPDGPAELLQSAEETLGDLQCHGDCEDFAVTMMALSSSIGQLRSRIVVCRGRSHDRVAYEGHAFCEVWIAPFGKTASAVSARFAHHLGLPHVETRQDSDGVWLVLDFSLPDRPFAGEIYCFINADGTIDFPRPDVVNSWLEMTDSSRRHDSQLPF